MPATGSALSGERCDHGALHGPLLFATLLDQLVAVAQQACPALIAISGIFTADGALGHWPRGARRAARPKSWSNQPSATGDGGNVAGWGGHGTKRTHQ